VAQKRKSGIQISYVTITYRSVLLGISAILALIALVMYMTFPAASNRVISASEGGIEKLLSKLGLGGSAIAHEVDPGPQQAHFTNIAGVVRVKKAVTGQWVQADYGLALERNDVVQTSAEGIAKVVFTDGTNYTVKPNSLIVVQENFVNPDQKTEVKIQVTVGTVDLYTSNISPGSKSQVTVGEATATFSSQSQAEVQNDPRNDQHAIFVKKGSGEVNRAGQDLKIADNEKVSFTSDAKEMTKTKEISPPFLIGPYDNQQVALAPSDKGVLFYWSEVTGSVRAYHLKISKTPFFTATSMVYDRNVTGSQITLALPEGTYWWVVQTIEDTGKESMESPKNKFSLVPKGSGNANIALELGDLVQIGHVIEVKGRTEAGARVMVNGQEAVVAGDGTFRHFTGTLPTGENMITVTAQNTKGGVNTKQVSVTIQ
jgi:hypothetical protein